MSTENVKVVISARDTTKTAFTSASTGLRGIGTSAKGLMTNLIGPLGLIAGIGLLTAKIGKGIKATADFESQLSNISTLISGDSTEAIDGFREGIHDLMKEIPVTGEELGASAYAIVSAGISDTAEALDVLKASSRLAVAGLGSTEEATDLVTSAINSFGIDAKEAEGIANTLFLTVKSGKTTVTELARGFGQIAPLASQMDVSLEDLMATTAALTTGGMKASIVYASLRGAFSNLLKPTSDMTAVMEEAGITFNDVQKSLGEDGIVKTIRMMTDAAGGSTDAVAKMFGSVEGLNSVLALMNETGEVSMEVYEGMTNGADNLTEAVNKQTEQFNAQWQLLKNQTNVAFQELAVQILPHLIAAMKLAGEVGEVFGIIYDGVTEGLTKLILTIDKVISKLQSLIALAKKASNNVISNVSAGAGALVGTVSNVLGFADGGVVPGPIGTPVPAIVHGGETVIPSGRSIGNNITINNPVLLDNTMIERLSSEIGRVLRNDIRV